MILSKQIIRNGTQVILVLLLLSFVLGPVLWLLISSISLPKDLIARPPHWIPRKINLSHYRNLLFGSGGADATLTDYTLRAFRIALGNSVIVAAGVTLLCLFFGTMSGYAAARLKSAAGSKVIYILLVVQMLPVVVLLVPLYVVLSRIGFLDRLSTVIVLLSAIHLPFVIWILRGFFLSIPFEIEEAALVDGATRTQVLLRVILPVSLPGLCAAGAYTLMQSWNAFIIPLVFTSSDTSRTVTVAIAMFVGRHYTDYGLMSAAGVLASVPPMLIALIFQRYLLNGLTAGAVKG